MTLTVMWRVISDSPIPNSALPVLMQNIRSRLLWFAPVVSFCLFCNFGGAQDLSVTVVDNRSGEPLKSAEVTVARDGDPLLRADLDTDANGQIRIEILKAGKYRIGIAKSNYVKSVVDLNIESGRSVDVPIALLRCGVISGHVTDDAGNILRNSEVIAVATGADGSRLHKSEVDENGNYRLGDLEPGDYLLGAVYGTASSIEGSIPSEHGNGIGSGLAFFPSNEHPSPLRITEGEQHSNIDFSVQPGQRFHVGGRLVTSGGNLAGFSVSLIPKSQLGFAVSTTQSDDHGRFDLHGVTAGSYTLLASGPSTGISSSGAILDKHPSFGRVDVEVLSDVDDVSLPMTTGGAALFVVQGDPSTVCNSGLAQIRLSAQEAWNAALDRTITVAGGKQQKFEDFAPGKYSLRATSAGNDCYASTEQQLDFTTTRTSRLVSIKLVALGGISGRLLHADAASVVVLVPLLRPGDYHIVVPNKDGSFLFDHLQPGRYRLSSRGARRSGASSDTTNHVVEAAVAAGVISRVDIPE